MTDQLLFLSPDRSWRLDEATRSRGLAGVAAARAIVAESRVRARAAALTRGESLDLHDAA